MEDPNPRPLKRQRSALEPAAPSSSPLSSPPASSQPTAPAGLRPLPPHELLLALPGVFTHAPDHRAHVRGLALSLDAMRRCLKLDGLTADVECRARTALVELGMKAVEAGFSRSAEHPWAHGIESEIEGCLAKALVIANKHPVLRGYFLHLSLLQAHFAHVRPEPNPKHARKLLERVLSGVRASDPACHAYRAHLLQTAHLLAPPSGTFGASDLDGALAAVHALRARAEGAGHAHVVLLAHVLHARVLVGGGRWDALGGALAVAEAALALDLPDAPPAPPPQGQAAPPAAAPALATAFEAALAVHVLMLGVVFRAHAGHAGASDVRLRVLHSLLDAGALERFPDGTFEVDIPESVPLVVRVTHPRVLLLLAYLVSATGKRDVLGRKPKRRVFVVEGLRLWEGDALRELSLAPWAGAEEAAEVDMRIARIKAELYCELAAISIMRSEFDAAEEALAQLVAHARTTSTFTHYRARITLLHAHLAHALGRADRARACYRLAHELAVPGTEIAVVAHAGLVALEVGEAAAARAGLAAGAPAADASADAGDVAKAAAREQALRERAKDAARACRGQGAALEVVGEVLEAVAAPEIMRAKLHLKKALDRASGAHDNHARALVLALVTAYYLHTAPDSAQTMLRTARQLAAGLGAPPKDAKPVLSQASTSSPSSQTQTQTQAAGAAVGALVVGNAPLGMWVGERFLELYRRAGDKVKATQQTQINVHLARAVDDVHARGRALGSDST